MWEKAQKVEVTGVHVFGMASCRRGMGRMTFEGESHWMNPYGHLSGDAYGYLSFYYWMGIVYFILLCVFGLLISFRKELNFQNLVIVMLLLCLLEICVWYFMYSDLNNTGVQSQGLVGLGLIATATRTTFSRLLLVIFVMGLRTMKGQWIVLTCFYWVFMLIFEASIHYDQPDMVKTWIRVVVIPPVSICNGAIWYMVLTALQQKISVSKTHIPFLSLLTCTLIGYALFTIYQIHFTIQKFYLTQWHLLWFIEVGFGAIVSTIVFVAIMLFERSFNHLNVGSFSSFYGQNTASPSKNVPTLDNFALALQAQ
ncbi:seven transmembrane domain protein [Reticulomyxa filosa]|uniref:Seven transmembrane domain protein n=1 Tax=Reticulomyxa filosa TaxID=46433 RepID=X6MLB6_RETFI|nr:seven transmembrane domain protein [Reticulomyxa filosa]|eukprot:ETO14669.1 seven transmembrane domain protein [Reticulomyxa filosa]